MASKSKNGAAATAPVVEKLVLLDPDTGELKDLPAGVLPNRQALHTALAEEAHSKQRFLGRMHDRYVEGFAGDLRWLLVGAAGIAVGCVLGMWGQPLFEKQTQAAALYQAMKTAVPVVTAVEISVDPGRYVGKMVDVVMTVNRGGTFKSGKGLYLQEFEGGLALTIFESAFPQFLEAYQVSRPDEITSHLMGKYVKARGTVQQRGERLSLVVYAPGLLSEIPER